MGDRSQPVKHYCNVTFLSVGDPGPDGFPIERLVRCSRCKETYYCGRTQQKSHWKLHKKYCQPVERDEREALVGNLSLTAVLRGFVQVYFDPQRHEESDYDFIVGLPFRYLLEKLQDLSSNAANAVAPTDQEEAAANDLVSGQEFFQTMHNRTIELFWAIPGMTTYLLNLDIASGEMRRRKLEGAVPTSEELVFQGVDPSFQNTCPYFSRTVCYFLIASMFRTDSNSEICFVYRNTPVASVASRKIMQWYADPYTRASLPSSAESVIRGRSRTVGVRDVLFTSTMQSLLQNPPDDPFDSAAVVPGLTPRDVIQIMTTEVFWIASMHKEAMNRTISDLVWTASRNPTAWQAFSVEARAYAAHKIIGLHRNVSVASPALAQENLTDLLLIVLGYSILTGEHSDAIWLQVVQLASTKKSATGINYPFGPHTDYFSEQYHSTGDIAANLFYNLFLDRTILPLDLLPPTPVLKHIVEYAMDPFAGAPFSC